MKKILFLFIILGFFSYFGFAVAEDIATQCANVSNSGCTSTMASADCKNLLQKCAEYYDAESAKISEDITKTAAQKSTLQTEVSSLKKKITNLEYQIKQSSVMVKGLNVQITETEQSIEKASEDINSSVFQIKSILRAIYEEDQTPSFVILLEGSLSDFFGNITYLEGLDSKIGDLLENTKDLQAYLGQQKNKMDTEVDSLQKTIALNSAQKSENEANKKTQETYLQLTETQYQAQLANKTQIEKNKAKIQSLLFSLAGTSDTEAPSFGQAIEIAKSVGQLVGIRPAFLLAIISQESAIGKNVGQCYLSDSTTGSGKKISTGATVIRVMKPTRDVQPFLDITKALGRDSYKTPVSCWIPAYVSGQAYGWGGAMGPAQFIASTWCGTYDPSNCPFSDRLEKLLGKAPDPWAIKDSFTASALYLSDLGASAQTSAAENYAAGRYYGTSGSYNTSVMNRAACIQTFIDEGTMSTYCENLIF
jgi:peptidoglycan hydrolase CwlO-like protein